MKFETIFFALILSALAFQVEAAPKHCTNSDQDAQSFFMALDNLHMKISEYGLRLSPASLSLNKDFKLIVEQNPSTKKYSSNYVTDRTEVSPTCAVDLTLKSSNDESAQSVFKKGHALKFDQEDVNVHTWRKPYIGQAEMNITDKNIELQIKASEKCTALQVSMGLQKLGVDARFIGPKNDPICHPESIKIGRNDGLRENKKVEVVRQAPVQQLAPAAQQN